MLNDSADCAPVVNIEWALELTNFCSVAMRVAGFLNKASP